MSAESRRYTRSSKSGGRHAGGHGPGGAIGRPVEKAKDFKGTLKRLLQYLKPQRTSLTIVIIFAILSTTFTVLGPKILGNAMNQLTNGFIAKNIVNGLNDAQPKMQDALKAYNDAIDTAVKKADEAVESGVNSTVATQKQGAYDQAMKQADAIAVQKFNEAVAAQKQAAYSQAIKQADAVAVQKFNEATASLKQGAYAQAKTQAEAAAKAQVDQKFMAAVPGITADKLSGVPGYSDALKQAYAAADTKAVEAVDAQFASQLAGAKKTAETQAKAAVDSGFAAKKSVMDTQLANAKKMAEDKAKAAVDEAFVSKQSDIDSKITSAKQEAEQKARDAVDKAFMDKQNMTKEQLDTFLSLAKLPLIKSTNDFNQRADIAKTFFDDLKKLPQNMVSGDASVKSSNLNLSNISDENLNTYIKDIRETGGSIPFAAVARILIFLLFIYVLSSVFAFVMQYIMSSVAQGVVYNMRKDVDEKLSRLPLKYFDSHSNGEILSRMTNDIDTVSSTLQQSLTQLIQAVLQIVGYLIMMLTISPILTLIVMLTLPLYVLVTALIAKKSQKFYAAQQKYLGELSGHTEEMYTGHKIVKAFGHEKDSIETFETINDDLYNAGWKAQFLSGSMFPLMNFISNIGYVIISVAGGIFVTKTWLNIGDITAFIQYSRQFSMPIVQTANIANIIQSTVACAERVFEVLDEEEEISDTENAKVIEAPRGDIKFDHVKFSYKETEPLIEDMNLDIKKGETIAIVGPTGAGKTTLVNLLMRFYEINGGNITFDGVNVRDIKRGSLRTMFGMVLQDTWLFNGSIEDNIRYGREGATHEQVVAAAKAVHADRFIRSLPDGYKTVLNEEASNISQGQKQLLTIARAILADPAVLILDEATSSVDTRTEVLIQKAMGRLMEGRTNFVIAHRLSTIRDAKLILVMNHGSIIESGTHQQLLEKKGFYADIYNSQFTGPSIDEQAV
ncbi:MAG: ABC transporter transmembrane domain-containing protein [Bacillota bacterium]|nr:ABC transporter transmembrane domain-containing protein [Bacillota bacterium]